MNGRTRTILLIVSGFLLLERNYISIFDFWLIANSIVIEIIAASNEFDDITVYRFHARAWSSHIYVYRALN